MKNKLALLLLAAMVVVTMLLGCSDRENEDNDKDIPSLPFPSMSDEGTKESETKSQETDSPVEQIESPVPVEEAHALIAERLEMAEGDISFTGSEYFKYDDTTYIFYFEFDDAATYAPVAVKMTVEMRYALNESTDEWEYSSYSARLGGIADVTPLLGEWVCEDDFYDYYIKITKVTDTDVTFSFNIDGETGEETVRYSAVLDGLQMVIDRANVTLIGPKCCDSMRFTAFNDGRSGWYINDQPMIPASAVEPEPEKEISKRAQGVIDYINKCETEDGFYYDSIDLQYDYDKTKDSYEVCVQAVASEINAPLVVRYQFIYQGGNFGSRLSKEIVAIENSEIMTGTWTYSDGENDIRITVSNIIVGVLDVTYEINGKSAERSYKYKHVMNIIDEEIPYMGIRITDRIEGYEFGFYVNYHDAASAGWYVNNEMKLEKVD